MITGVINVKKEQDYSSHDVVNIMRGILKTKKVGHSGTLDPMATGVLNIYVGRATKFVDILKSDYKTYRAGILFGHTSDTLDIWGDVKKTSDGVPGYDELSKVLHNFLGKSTQVAPMYSAKKVNGKKLYEYARKGIEIEREPYEIDIRHLSLVGYNENSRTFDIDIRCSKGTYVRSLIEDIGKSLGLDAIMSSLVRTENDNISVSECHTLSEIKEMVESGDFSFATGLDEVAGSFRRVDISDQLLQRLIYGQTKFIQADCMDERISLFNNGYFVGTATWEKEGIFLKEKLV